MTDGALLALGAGALAAGVGAVVLARRLGVPSTYARDLLHVGAGIWPLSWPLWSSGAVAIALACAGAAALAAVPLLAGRLRAAAAIHRSVTGGDETWGGLTLYATSAALLTLAAFAGARREATAGFWALALGDGLGGLIGRRWGRRKFRVPGAKTKSLEGALAVLAFAALGIALAGAWSGRPFAPALVAAGAAAAMAAEALSPRGSDNLTVPLAVTALLWLTRA